MLKAFCQEKLQKLVPAAGTRLFLFLWTLFVLRLGGTFQDWNGILWCNDASVLKKQLRALRGYFGPPMSPNNENCFSPNSSY